MAARPDIIWILTTQWRAQSTGFGGDPDARTPILDSFAKEAVVFDQAFTNHPFGPFARALLLTGELSPQNGVAEYWDPLPTTKTTVAHRLAAAGYETAFFGKWHLGRRDPHAPVVGEAHAKQVIPDNDRGGFAFWEGFESGFLLNDPWLHGTRLSTPQQFAGYQSDILSNRAGQWIGNRNKAQPLFAVISLEAPHPPYAAPVPQGIQLSDPASLTLAPNVPRHGEIETTARRELAGYLAHVEATDRAIGTLLGAISNNHSAVFVTSVHGDMHGAHGLFRKGWPYEESIRVPLLTRLPGSAPGHVRTPVSLADLPATALKLAGLETPQDWIGDDLRSIPDDTDRDIPISMPSVPPFSKQCPEQWDGIRNHHEVRVCRRDGTPWLRFDLRADPWQLRNLAVPRRA